MEQKKLHTLFGSEIIFRDSGEMPERRGDERRPTTGRRQLQNQARDRQRPRLATFPQRRKASKGFTAINRIPTRTFLTPVL